MSYYINSKFEVYVKRIITMLLVLVALPVIASENSKNSILSFEQSIPWSDVYDTFKTRQKSWHNDVLNAETPDELGRLLVELQNFIIADRLGDDWKIVKDNWILKTAHSKTYDDIIASLEVLKTNYFKTVNKRHDSTVKKELITFEQYVPWDDVKEGFKDRQQAWRFEVINASTPPQLSKLLLEFHNWIYPENFSDGWVVIQHAWIKKAKSAETWQDVRVLLKELQRHYTKKP